MKVEVASKHTFANAFVSRRPIEVEAPELGEGVVVRFKPEFTVDDVLTILAVKNWQDPLVFDILLARVAMIDEEGKPLVDDNNDKWFSEGTDGTLICRLSKRANLSAVFLKAFKRSEDDPDGDKELTGDALQQTISDLSLAMKLSPESIRSWPAKDLADVLRASARVANKGDETDDTDDG